MVKKKKKIKKKKIFKNLSKRTPKKRKKQKAPPDIIFDSTVGKTDALFVSNPEPVQESAQKPAALPQFDPVIAEALNEFDILEKTKQNVNQDPGHSLGHSPAAAKKNFWKRLFSLKNKLFLILIILVLIGFCCSVAYIWAGSSVSGLLIRFLNSESPERIKITKIENSYSLDKDIIIAGLAQKNSKIILLWNNQLGLVKADGNGKWIVNLGKMPEGKYNLQLIADDSLQSYSIATAQISVSKVSIFSFFSASLSSVMQKTPDKIIMVSEDTPEVLQDKWDLIK